ncbi:MAG: class I SAM-dependent methyltransferase [Rhodanobacteraceae bacterium]
MPDHHQVQRFYDEEYYAHNSDTSALPWHMRKVASRLGVLQDKSVLDVACGRGEWLLELQRRGAHPAGIDISGRAAEYARVKLSGADIRQGVAEELPFGNSQFDLVTCMGSLEHFLDQARALKEMIRVAKSDATFLILVPNAGFLTRRLGFYGGTGQVAVRETVRSIGEWTAILEDAGLHVLKKWRDLHPLSWGWIRHGAAWTWPVRAAQAMVLPCWPVRWQYQVYFVCSTQKS